MTNTVLICCALLLVPPRVARRAAVPRAPTHLNCDIVPPVEMREPETRSSVSQLTPTHGHGFETRACRRMIRCVLGHALRIVSGTELAFRAERRRAKGRFNSRSKILIC